MNSKLIKIVILGNPRVGKTWLWTTITGGVVVVDDDSIDSEVDQSDKYYSGKFRFEKVEYGVTIDEPYFNLAEKAPNLFGQHANATAFDDPVLVAAARKTLEADEEFVQHATADLFIICYNVMDKTSLRAVKKFWLPLVMQKAIDTSCLLVGCQIDLLSLVDEVLGKNPVREEDVAEVMSQSGGLLVSSTFVSAALGEGIEDLKTDAIWSVLKQRISISNSPAVMKTKKKISCPIQ